MRQRMRWRWVWFFRGALFALALMGTPILGEAAIDIFNQKNKQYPSIMGPKNPELFCTLDNKHCDPAP